jgi:hypothetical protein
MQISSLEAEREREEKKVERSSERQYIFMGETEEIPASKIPS